ncbi:MAG: 2-oxoacid:acceptor oxidoreductase family protein [Nitrospinota bacterium]
MRYEVLAAGAGGQGVLLLGEVMAYGAMLEGREVAWVPSYGPEMRGGTANCSLVIADVPLGSPLVEEADLLIILNEPSLERFRGRLKAGGVLLWNSSTIKEGSPDEGRGSFGIPANELALKAGNVLSANMVMLGAAVELTGVLRWESLERALEHYMAGRKERYLELNRKALHEGANFLKNKILSAKT